MQAVSLLVTPDDALELVGFDGYVTMGIGLDSRFADLDKIARTALKFLKDVE